MMIRSLLILLAGISIDTGLAQTPDAAPGQASASISSLGPASAPAPSDSRSLTLDYLYHRKPEDGTEAAAAASIAGAMEDKTRALDALTPPGLDDPIRRKQFATYLGLPEVPADRIKTYSDKMDRILSTLKNKNAQTAWEELVALGDYPDIDAGVSRELAYQVGSILNNGRTTLTLAQANGRLRQMIETSNWNADQITQKLRNQGYGAGAYLAGGYVPGNFELAGETATSLEARARIELNDLQAGQLADQSQADFADYVTMLFNSHRHDQVILAAGFYRCLFATLEYLAPISQAVSASLKINQQVDADIQAFRYKADRGEIAAATDSLVHAFLDNPNHPAVLGVLRARKQQVNDYLCNLDLLKNSLEVRDFSQVEGIVGHLKQIASDFDSTKPLAWMESAKVEGNLHLGQARLLSQQGKQAEATAQFQAAADFWPGNPELLTTADSFFKSQDEKHRAMVDFDRLADERNYRAMVDRQTVFAPAIVGSASREAQLKTAFDKVSRAKMASEKAARLAGAGGVYGAWETIDLALKDWPEDPQLNQMLADLSARGPAFAVAVSRAREAEARAELGYSLGWYVNAQSFYPPSRIAREGIDRVSKQILTSRPPENN